MTDRGVSGSGPGPTPPRVQPSVAAFYDWSSNITGCVQVRQYHQHQDQGQQYYQQAYNSRLPDQLPAAASGSIGGSSAQVFPVRRPSKATLAKMRQYYNPGVRLLQAGRPADQAWREAGQPTKGERHLALARGAAARAGVGAGVGTHAGGAVSQVFSWEEDPSSAGDSQHYLMSASSLKTSSKSIARLDNVGDCQCSYDPRIYPVYTSRTQGPMCVVCKRRRRNRLQTDTIAAETDAVNEDDEGATMAPPSTPQQSKARAQVAAVWDGERRATTLDIFLPNAERVPASPLPRPSSDSARSQRTLSSPEPPSLA